MKHETRYGGGLATNVTMSQCHRGGGSVTTCDKCDKGDEQATTFVQSDSPMSCQAEAPIGGQVEASSAVLFDIAPKQSTAAWDDDCPF